MLPKRNAIKHRTKKGIRTIFMQRPVILLKAPKVISVTLMNKKGPPKFSLTIFFSRCRLFT